MSNIVLSANHKKTKLRRQCWVFMSVAIVAVMGTTASLAKCPQGKVEVSVTGRDGFPKSFVTVQFFDGGKVLNVVTGAGGVVCATLSGGTYAVRVVEREKVQTFPKLAVDQLKELKVKW